MKDITINFPDVIQELKDRIAVLSKENAQLVSLLEELRYRSSDYVTDNQTLRSEIKKLEAFQIELKERISSLTTTK